MVFVCYVASVSVLCCVSVVKWLSLLLIVCMLGLVLFLFLFVEYDVWSVCLLLLSCASVGKLLFVVGFPFLLIWCSRFQFANNNHIDRIILFPIVLFEITVCTASCPKCLFVCVLRLSFFCSYIITNKVLVWGLLLVVLPNDDCAVFLLNNFCFALILFLV